WSQQCINLSLQSYRCVTIVCIRNPVATIGSSSIWNYLPEGSQMSQQALKIGELALQTGSSVETIRYYEQQDLLPQAMRSASNYRLYGDEHVKRLQFIRHCRSLDMTLDEIRTLLSFRDT